ncbi:MAG: YbaK/EbsC family protein [Planctomycetota bacterium]
MSVVADRVKHVLDEHFVCYETLPHVTDYTALETSEHTHTPGNAFAKAVILLVEHELVMAVIPAHHHVDLESVRRYLGARHIKLAREWRIRHHFKDCDPGAIPPFGNLYGMRVLVSPVTEQNHAITFNAGSHEMVISISYDDYRTLVRPERVPELSSPWRGGGG